MASLQKKRTRARLSIFLSLAVAATASAMTPPGADKPGLEQKVSEMLAKLTPEEKLDLIGGDKDFYVRAIPKIGLPELRMADGPMGVRNAAPTSTAYPAEIALAATFDPALANSFGTAMGRDARARGVHFLLGPAVDMYRVPVCGRNAEYMGEDPYLTGTMAVQIIRGVQSQGVVATIKHFVGNEQEFHRMTASSEIDERTLREINLRPFEMAVRDSGVWAFMCAYNKLNGTYCSANDWLQNQVLKKEWGFQGLEMSDWGAAHDALGCANGGLDLEMPGGKFMNRKDLAPMIADGRVSQATIDEKCRRILRVAVAMNFLTQEQKDSTIPMDDPKSSAVALEIAREGTVLLKNEGNLLPLDRTKVKSIVVLGPNADPAVTGAGGSSHVKAEHSVSIFAGLTKIGGENVKVTRIPWTIDSAVEEAVKTAEFSAPIQTEFFAGKKANGKVIASREDTAINFDWKDQSPMPGVGPQDFSARFSTKIRPKTSGLYLMVVKSDDGSRVTLDGKRLLNNWSDHQMKAAATLVDLTADRDHDLRVEYYNGSGQAAIQFGYAPAPEMLDDAAKKQIAAADVAIVCAGYNESTNYEGEGSDRKFSLPDGQDGLIAKTAELNPHTIVITNSGGNTDSTLWFKNVPAMIHAWFPGQDGGTAIAEILFGDINPSGKLPATFERKFEDNAAFGNYPGENDVVHYAEGLFFGYRHFDKKNIEPLFCFGHGLSYTTFNVDNINAVSAGDGDGRKVKVTVDVANTGQRAGSEVVQAYVGRNASAIDRPVKILGAFQRVTLAPGEKKTLTMEIGRDQLAYYDVASHSWKIEPGEYLISVGNSSRNLPEKIGVSW